MGRAKYEENVPEEGRQPEVFNYALEEAHERTTGGEPMLLVPSVSQREVQKILDLRQQGMTWNQVGRLLHRHAGTVSRYERVYQMYGIEVFAK